MTRELSPKPSSNSPPRAILLFGISFGLRVENVPGDFLGRLEMFPRHRQTIPLLATAMAAGGVLLIILFAKYLKPVPGSIVVLLAGTAAVVLFNLPVEAIGTRFGGIPSGLPRLSIPEFRLDLFPVLFLPALTVTLLGAIESLMSAVVADRMSGDRHDPNTELVAQGIANMASPLFGG